ncbi:MAG: hypothetical protein HY080_04415 [Gammaproteobacteria bacterium]|nr:hypothetical protein [Gammaproteobacteria bacterium]
MIRITFKVLVLGLALLQTGCSWVSGLFAEKADDVAGLVQRLNPSSQTDSDANPPPVVQLPVRVNYTFKSKPLANEDLDVEIEYMALKDINSLKLGYTTSDGLEVVSSAPALRYTDLKQYAVITHHLTLLPQSEGHYFLHLFVVTQVGEQQQGKEISIPIALGKYSLEAAPAEPENL